MPGTVRRLVLLRHAKAEHSGVADELRRLTSLGVRQAGGVGSTLRATGLLPERVLVSSAVRTQETWAHLVAELADEPAPEVVLADELYGAHALEVLEQVKATDARVRTLLVVGHEPLDNLDLAAAAHARDDRGGHRPPVLDPVDHRPPLLQRHGGLGHQHRVGTRVDLEADAGEQPRPQHPLRKLSRNPSPPCQRLPLRPCLPRLRSRM